MVKHYTNGEITIVWKPEVCQHSKICWTELLSVFDPRKHPWIDMSGADTQRIIQQVNRCPSGALSYYHNEDKKNDTESAG